MTGNVINLAAAVLLAGTTGVVKGFVSDIMMPIVGQFTGGIDFSQLKFVLSPALIDTEGAITSVENAIMYGNWINAIINLIIVGFVLFMVVKASNKFKKPMGVAPDLPAGPTQENLLAEIKDLLKK